MDSNWLEMYAKIKVYEWLCGTAFGSILFLVYITFKIQESGLTKRAADLLSRLAKLAGFAKPANR